MASAKFRAIFFWFLVVIFLTIAPVIVFYAMGYRFSPERGIFVYSGSITLKTNPQEIEVLINDKPVAKGIVNFINYSYHIDGLSPGEYSLEVRSPDYRPWNKKINIHSGVSTEFWNIFLARKEYTALKYPSEYLQGFFMSPDSKKIALVEGDTNTTVKILDVKKEKIEYEFSVADYAFSKNMRENVEWSPREGHLTIPMQKNGKQEYFIIDIGNEKVFNLNNIIKKDNVRQVRWSAGEKNVVLYVFENSLYKLDLNDKEAKEVLIAQNIAGYDLSADDIYYFNKDSGIIYQKNSRGNSEEKQISSASITAQTGEDFKLIVYDKDRIAVISQDKDFYLFNKSDKAQSEEKVTKIKEGISGLHFSNDGKKIVFWNDNEVFAYFVREWKTQPSRDEGYMINVLHFSQKVENVSWFRDYEHIIFNIGNTIKITELDHRSMRNIHDLYVLKNSESEVRYTPREDNIFFIDSGKEFVGNGLYSISLEEETLND